MPASSNAIRWLRTHAGYVVDGNGKGVVFRGITADGLDAAAPAADQTLADALGLSNAGLSAIFDLWKLNVIRVPFRAQTVLAGNGALSSTDVLAGLDGLIQAVSDARGYVMLSQQAPGGTALPDEPVFEAWNTLATRYVDEPAVLFEPFASDLPLAANWLDAALLLVGLIRSQHPASLLFLGNGTGGADVGGLPLRFSTGDPVPNIVYTIAVDPAHPPNGADARLAEWTDSFPLVACPWSNGGPAFDRTPELAAEFFSRYGLGWIASNWSAAPRLVEDAAGVDLTPTGWGLTVRRAVALPTRPQYVRILSG
ncbi:MAG TPA: cellulase family glycosylhydrolase [bacterium]|nr:cellulase family glycosylhydrolase [bacterium]